MRKIGQCCARSLLLSFVLFFAVFNLRAEDSLVWHKDNDRVDADIESWDLKTLLEHVAASTGWQVYLDPGAIHQVSVKFKDASSGEALHLMLTGLNFAMVPQASGLTRLYVFRTSRNQATRLIRAYIPKSARPIQNELIVTLKKGSKTKIEDLARALGAKIIGRMDAQNSYLLQFDDPAATQSALQQLLNNPDVASVDVNYPVDPPPGISGSSAAADQPDLKLKPDANNNCQLMIGLIDTPIQPVSGNLTNFVLPQIHVAGDVQLDPSTLTHGTAMLYTALDGVSTAATTPPQPGGGATGGLNTTTIPAANGPTASSKTASTSVKILPVDVYGNNSSTTTFDVANGIYTAINNGANIINLSLGSSADSSYLHNIITQGAQQGVQFYAAAGNTPVTAPTYPAAYPEVVSVTAGSPDGQIASYANRGSFVNMIEPGDNVVPYNGQSWLVEGTSTSTAFATGTAAGLADQAGDCANQAESLLQKSLPSTAILKPAQ